MLSLRTAAALQLAIHCMAQEAAFGLHIVFPSEVAHLADKPMDELTEEEAQQLVEAGHKARQNAMYA